MKWRNWIRSEGNTVSPQQVFWKWFTENEAELLDFEVGRELERERVFDRLQAQLRKVHPDLTFEFGPRGQRREFIISADGIKGAFPAVSALVSAAPSLDRWQISGFRPRHPPMTIALAGKQVDPKDVQVSLLDNGKIAGIYMFIPGFSEKDAVQWKQIGYLLLDNALGEYDVETKVGLIEFLPPEEKSELERFPLTELPRLFQPVDFEA